MPRLQLRPPPWGTGPAVPAALPAPPPPVPSGPIFPFSFLPPLPAPPFFVSWQVSDLAEQLEERLFQLYSLHNEQIQQRLHELAEVMERVQQAEDELQHVCHTVEAAYKDLCLQPEA